MRAWLSLSFVCLAACTQELPGDVVGTYRVTMKLEENTCGANAVYLQDGREYSVEIRSEERNSQGYWHLADTSPIPGKYENDSFEFKFSALVASAAEDAGASPCRLQQDEVLSGMIVRAKDANGGEDAGAADAGEDAGVDAGSASDDTDMTRLEGTHVLSIGPYSGTDCSMEIAAKGGIFEALPCRVRYSLSGRERKPF
jgi:hypothetical protein